MVSAYFVDGSCFHKLIRAFFDNATFYTTSGHDSHEHDSALCHVDEIGATNEEAMTNVFDLLPENERGSLYNGEK